MAKNQIDSVANHNNNNNNPNPNKYINTNNINNSGTIRNSRTSKRKVVNLDKLKSSEPRTSLLSPTSSHRMASVGIKEAKSLSTYHGDKILKIRNTNNANLNDAVHQRTINDYRPKTSGNVSIRKLCKFKNKSIETIITAIDSEKSDSKSVKSDLQEYYQQSKNSSANNSNNSNAASVHNVNGNESHLNHHHHQQQHPNYFKINELRMVKKSANDSKQLFERKLNEQFTHTNNDFNKLNVYKSYLNYSSVNPFSSNYDVVNKKKNSELFSDSTYRFNRANSSLSLISQSLDMKKFSSVNNNAANNKDQTIKRENSELLNDMDKFTSSYLTPKQGALTSRMFPVNSNVSMNISAITNSNNNNNNNNVLNNNTSMVNMVTQKSSLDTLKSQIRILEKTNKTNATTNQFLTYRNDENKSNLVVILHKLYFSSDLFSIQSQ